MKKLIYVLENKRSIAGLLMLAGLIFTTYSIQEDSNQIKRLTNFENGIQTCFTRVNQTYTANLLGDAASVYLTQNFQNLTEECLAEGILTVENSFQTNYAGTAKLLSNLASNVHWFHEDILAPISAKNLASKGQARDVGSRFEKIEMRKDEILEATNTFKSQISRSQNLQKNFFYVSATLLVILMMAEYMSLTRRRFSNNLRENEAYDELLNNGGGASVKVGEIIRVALEQNDLINCSKLFANFHAYTNPEKGKNKMSLEALITPIEANTNRPAFNIDKMWDDDSMAVSADIASVSTLHNMNLENISSIIIDMLAEKLFSQGVQLEVNIPEALEIRARHEELEQTLYHLFAYAINSTSKHIGTRSISLSAHKLGDVVAFDLVHSGEGFDESLLKKRVGLETEGASLHLDLEICQTLLKEIEAKIQLDNKLDQNGNVIGGRVKIIFKAAIASTENINQGRLVDLKVGSKKEILAAMSANQ